MADIVESLMLAPLPSFMAGMKANFIPSTEFRLFLSHPACYQVNQHVLQLLYTLARNSESCVSILIYKLILSGQWWDHVLPNFPED